MLQPTTRGPLTSFGFTFGDLSGCPSLFYSLWEEPIGVARSSLYSCRCIKHNQNKGTFPDQFLCTANTGFSYYCTSFCYFWKMLCSSWCSFAVNLFTCNVTCKLLKHYPFCKSICGVFAAFSSTTPHYNLLNPNRT